MIEKCKYCVYYHGVEYVKTVGGSHYDEYDSYYLLKCGRHSTKSGETQNEIEDGWCNRFASTEKKDN